MLAPRRFALEAPLLTLTLLVGCNSDRADLTAPSFSVTPPPSGTQAIAVSESRIDVKWQDNSSNEAGFEVHRSLTGATGTFTLLVTSGANATSHSDLDLTAGTQYCYKLRSFRKVRNSISYSSFTVSACAITLPPPAPPSAPSGMGTTPRWSQIYVSWSDNSATEAGFRVERSTDGGASWVTAFSTGANATGGSEVWVTEQVVCYHTLAFNAAGDSPSSETACTALPAAPGPLTVTTTDDQTFDLAWGDNSQFEDGYEVVGAYCFGPYRSLGARPADATGLRLTLAELEATLGPPLGPHIGHPPIGEYSFLVRATKGVDGYSADSDLVYLTPYLYSDCSFGW